MTLAAPNPKSASTDMPSEIEEPRLWGDGDEQPDQVHQQRDGAGDDEGDEGGQGAQQRLAFIRQEAQFFDHHRVHPQLRIARLDLDHARRVLCRSIPDGGRARKFGLLALRIVFHFPGFALAFAVVVFLLALGREIGPGGHREAVGELVGQPQDEHDVRAEVAPATPLTTAKVVMMPSSPPYTISPMY